MNVAIQSNIGRVRQNNEDRADVRQDLNGLILAIVADGMGGHQAGETASHLAVDEIINGLEQVSSQLDEEQCRSTITQAMIQANHQVHERSKSDPILSGMGTTVVLALASSEWVHVAHVGDSRCYYFSSSGYQCLTTDHSLVNELLKTGQITSSEAEIHPQRNVLLRALGTDEEIEVELNYVPWQKGDHLLLCSDGLTDLVPEEQINEVVASTLTTQEKADELIQKALQYGGDDNITVVVIENR
jgi:serine/threonine protein phosphatase PrpC